MKNIEELKEFLNSQLTECELERDRWFGLSRVDERSFIKESVEYQRGKINMIRHLQQFLKENG